MNLKLKSLWMTLLFVPMTLGLVGCSGSGSPSTPKSPPTSPKASVTLALPQGGTREMVLDTLPCTPGQVHRAEADVRTEGMTQGNAQLGIRFESSQGEILGYGGPIHTPAPAAAIPSETASTAQVRLGIQGKAPERATRAVFFLKIQDGAPGSTALLDNRAFAQVPAEPIPASPGAAEPIPPPPPPAKSAEAAPAPPAATRTTSGAAAPAPVASIPASSGAAEPIPATLPPAKSGAAAPAPPAATRTTSGPAATFPAASIPASSSAAELIPPTLPPAKSGAAAPAPPAATRTTSGPAAVPPALPHTLEAAPTRPGVPPSEEVIVWAECNDTRIPLGKFLDITAFTGGTQGRVHFQWLHNGLPIKDNPTATSAFFRIGSIGKHQEGDYQVRVADGHGITVSEPPIPIEVVIPGETKALPPAPKVAPVAVPTWRTAPGDDPARLPAAMTLLPHMKIVPAERNQGATQSCWVWAATAAIELEMSLKYQIKDRLSVQFFQSIYRPLEPGDPDSAFEKGNPDILARTYMAAGMLVPWSNPEAQFQAPEGAARPRVGLLPHYPLRSLAFATLDTHRAGFTNQDVIHLIKASLNRGKAVLYNNGAHYTAIVGYDDRGPSPYWILLDSFGASAARPQGTVNVPFGAIQYLETSGGFQNHTFEVLAHLDLDLPPPDGKNPQPLPFVEPSGDVALRPGDTLTLSAGINAVPPVTYQWLHQGVEIGTGSVLSIPSVTSEHHAGDYQVAVKGAGGDWETRSHRVHVSVDPGAVRPHLGTVTVTMDPPIVRQGEALELKAVSHGPGDGGAPACQWYRSGVALPGKTDPRLVIANAQREDRGIYWVEVTGPGGRITSAQLPVAVQEPERPRVPAGRPDPFATPSHGPTPAWGGKYATFHPGDLRQRHNPLTVQILGDPEVPHPAGQNLILHAVANKTHIGLHWQWLRDGKVIAGENGPTLNRFVLVTGTFHYQVELRADTGETAVSEKVTVTVKPLPAKAGDEPKR